MSEQFCYHMSITEFVENNFRDIRAPFLAGIELTAKCNLKCVHCYAKNGIYDKDITTNEVFRILDALFDNGTLGVYFTGGEIFTRPDFEEIYLYTKKKGMSISLLSNITLITEKHIKLFIEYPVSEISTTLYGVTESTYEAVTGVKGSYQKFIKALNLLKKYNIPVSLKYVVVRENLHEVYMAQKFAEEYNCKIMTAFSIHSASDGDQFPLEHRVSAKDAFSFDLNDEKRRRFWDGKAEELLQEKKGTKPPHTYMRKDQGYFYPCDISWHSTFISHTGMMQACTKTSYGSYDLLHGDFQTGWEYLKREFIDKKAPLRCLICDKFYYCEQCTANFLSETTDIPQIDCFFCEVAELRKKYVETKMKSLSLCEEN